MLHTRQSILAASARRGGELLGKTLEDLQRESDSIVRRLVPTKTDANR